MPSNSTNKKKSRYSQPRFLITFFIVMGVFGAIRHVFSIDIPLKNFSNASASMAGLLAKNKNNDSQEEAIDYNEDGDYDMEDSVDSNDEIDNNRKEWDTVSLQDSILADSDSLENGNSGSIDVDSNKHCVSRVWSYNDCFPDIQDVQLAAAQRNGIKPVKSRAQAEKLAQKHKLVNVHNSPFYMVDNLTHSMPYLVPKAQHLLNTISLNFIDSCSVKGMPVHLPIVTSVLRTTDDVNRLQKGNKNATTNSCHCYGTTVDIAYNKFAPIGSYDPKTKLTRWNEPMKMILAEVLYDLREQGKCYVKYERKQGCFHLTCR